MENNSDRFRKDVRNAIRWYVFGCCCFVAVAIASIWFGWFVLRSQSVPDKEWPMNLVILAVAGGVLLWEIIKAFRFRHSMPDDFSVIDAEDFPALFDIINEVTSELHMPPVHKVYVCPDATAAVVMQPRLRNILFEPEKELVIGLGFLTQLDDDEIRAMLYHEFGHYVQKGLKNSLSVYSVAQFSRLFVSAQEYVDSSEKSWKLQAKLQVLLFTYFTFTSCVKINKLYKKLAREMEYDADDVAVNYVGAPTLQRALLHAACIRYNYEAVSWGLAQLYEQNITVDDHYLALSYVSAYSRPSRRLLSDEVVRRVERLGSLSMTDSPSSAETVRQQAMDFYSIDTELMQVCPALRFAQWLRGGIEIFAQQRLLETSVGLIVHLDPKRHNLPKLDVTYNVLLDGQAIGSGNFIKGYTIRKKTYPGRHTLGIYYPADVYMNPYEFEVEAGKSYRFDMDYICYRDKGRFEIIVENLCEVDRKCGS